MEVQPAETLEIIFTQFSSIMDLRKCFNTCARWREIVEMMFKDKAKFIIYNKRRISSGGIAYDFINDRLEQGFTKHVRKCEGLTSELIKHENIRPCQFIPQSAHVQLSDSKIWITGGIMEDKWLKSMIDLKSTKFISLDKPPCDGPELPFSIREHSMVKVNSKNIYIIGGHQNSKNPCYNVSSSKTWIVDTEENFTVKEGPSLISTHHLLHGGKSIAKMNVHGKDMLIAIVCSHTRGNCCPEQPKQLEILDTTSPNQEWKRGSRIRHASSKMKLFTSPTGKSVILFVENFKISDFGTEFAEDLEVTLFEILPDSSGLIVCSILKKILVRQEKLQNVNFIPIHHESYINLTQNKRRLKGQGRGQNKSSKNN